MAKITAQDFRKKIIKTFPEILKITLFLRISKLEITDKNIWKNNNDFQYRIQEINPSNPLSWLFLIFYIPIGLLFQGVNKDSFNDIKELFKLK